MVEASPPDVPPPCAAPIIIDDLFDNEDLATPGPLSMGTGFTSASNASGGNGSSIERRGGALEIRTSNGTQTLAPAQGVVSNTGFSFNESGMTVRIEVTTADTPIWNGIVLALQSNQADIDASGDSLMLRTRGETTNSFTIDIGDQDPYAVPFGSQPYDEAALANGFVVTWTLDATSWSYVAEGLLVDGASIIDGGSYPVGMTPADLLVTTAYLAVHIQGNSADANQRILHVSRVTLWNGKCS